MRSGDTLKALMNSCLSCKGSWRWLSCALILAVAGGLLGSAEQAPAPRQDASRVDFTRQIRPLLSDRCFRCHGPDASRRKAELRLDLREGAFKKLPAGWAIVKPGDPGEERARSPHHH